MIENEQYMRISDFAKLCNVSKDTLFHYERIGILKPEIILENGYRYYSVKQFFTFDIISILKATGSSLKEIKSYLQNIDTDIFVSLLSEKVEILEKEHLRIEHMKNVLKNTIDITKRTISEYSFEPSVFEFDEQYLMVIDFEPDDSEKVRMQKIHRQYRYCLDKGLSETLTSGFIINESNLINRLYSEADSFFCEINHKPDIDAIMIKPKGKYAVLDHKGPYDTISFTFEKLLAFIDEKKLSIIGNAYLFELLGFVSARDPEKYIVKIAVQIG